MSIQKILNNLINRVNKINTKLLNFISLIEYLGISESKQEICWINNCNEKAFYHRKANYNPISICLRHYIELPNISKRNYYEIF